MEQVGGAVAAAAAEPRPGYLVCLIAPQHPFQDGLHLGSDPLLSCGCHPTSPRVADTYPNQMLDITARMYLYRWRPVEWCRAHPARSPYTLHVLQVCCCKGVGLLQGGGAATFLHICRSCPLTSALHPAPGSAATRRAPTKCI